MREKLAELCHKQWSGWIRYMFGKGIKLPDGGLYLPKWAVERWIRQADTTFMDLTAEERNSDRKEADKFIDIMKDPTDGKDNNTR